MKTAKVADGTVKIGDEVYHFPLDHNVDLVRKSQIVGLYKESKEIWVTLDIRGFGGNCVNGKAVFINPKSKPFKKHKDTMIEWHLGILENKKNALEYDLKDIIAKINKYISLKYQEDITDGMDGGLDTRKKSS